MSTIKDVAKMAQVSTTTVSRYLNEFPNIRPETRERIASAINALNYRANVAARGLVTKSTRTIGVVASTDVDDFFDNPFFMHVLKGISKAAVQRRYDVLLSTVTGKEGELLSDWIHGHRVDGIVLMKSRVDDPTLKMFACERFPAVLLGRPHGDEQLDYVDNDNVEAALRATQYLIDLGHLDIAFIGGSREMVVTEDRLKGFREALRQAAEPVHEEYVKVGQYAKQAGYDLCSQLLRLRRPPTAIVASDDIIATGALQAAHQLGCKVPQELSIIGFNDIPASEFTIPPLSTVRVHMERLGDGVAQLLFDRVQDPQQPARHLIIKTEIVVRNSTKVAPWRSQQPPARGRGHEAVAPPL